MKPKRCPFCGSKARGAFSAYEQEYLYSCSNMDCYFTSWLKLEEWNRRPIEEELKTRIRNAKSMLKDRLGEWRGTNVMLMPGDKAQIYNIISVLKGEK